MARRAGVRPTFVAREMEAVAAEPLGYVKNAWCRWVDSEPVDGLAVARND